LERDGGKGLKEGWVMEWLAVIEYSRGTRKLRKLKNSREERFLIVRYILAFFVVGYN
jgi:hypothetical protein